MGAPRRHATKKWKFVFSARPNFDAEWILDGRILLLPFVVVVIVIGLPLLATIHVML
jgi:hypothetical protein